MLFQRWASLRDSCDAFPMHLILIRTDTISRICKEKITPIAHVKIMEVAGRTDMCYIDDFLIKQVSSERAQRVSLIFDQAIPQSRLWSIFL